mmetsp:Transcript_2701/g.8400  ORF Transcript_2701/g.8400 Transcript_2701/m.8400 type:complete len:110 (-) Transcript_2701:7-336(-)
MRSPTATSATCPRWRRARVVARLRVRPLLVRAERDGGRAAPGAARRDAALHFGVGTATNGWSCERAPWPESLVGGTAANPRSQARGLSVGTFAEVKDLVFDCLRSSFPP